MGLHNLTEQYSCLFSILTCVFLTFLYVGSLYIWRNNLSRIPIFKKKSKTAIFLFLWEYLKFLSLIVMFSYIPKETYNELEDHPSTIKRRFFSVVCMMLVAPIFTYALFKEETLHNGTLYDYMGLRIPGMLAALIVPLLLTAILFLGPLTIHFFVGSWKLYSDPDCWFSNWVNLVWLRNHIMAPLSEEWVFRSCMMPLLLQCLDPLKAVFIGPFLFGIAHFHHVNELLDSGHSFKSALCISAFQFSYTTLFGAYSAFLFLRTGHFFAPLVAHVFCNHLGFPNFFAAFEFPIFPRIVILSNFVLGLVLWCYLLMPLTDPYIYDNNLQLLS